MSARNDETAKGDPLVEASGAVAWVIALNKPIYPLYVWWLAPDAFRLSLLTAILMPVYAAIPFITSRRSYATRMGLIATGTVDTLAITWLMGEASGAWLFLAPCITLCAVSFRASERWSARLSAAAIFALFALSFHRFGTPLAAFSEQDLATLFTLNALGAFALLAFIAIRYPGR